MRRTHTTYRTKLLVVVKLPPTSAPETFAPEQASAAAPLCDVQRLSVGAIEIHSNLAWNDSMNLPL
jgi:hypothetical protein